jgi:nickel transport protein
MRTIVTIIAISMLTVSTGWCHGVEGRVDHVKAHCITARYDDGEPMSYAAVEIKAPQSEIAFQTGRTDRNGRFLVKTDAPGEYQAVVKDGMGHRLALDFTVSPDDDGRPTDKSPSPTVNRQMSRPMKVVAGLSIIFGVCGFLYGLKARRPIQA